jgi:hypothetical protein
LEESDKHKLEGLLQARSEDLRHGRRPRNRRPVVETPPVQAETRGDTAEPAPTGRRCLDCGVQIAARRIRAMPGVTLCLACRRVAETGAPAS